VARSGMDLATLDFPVTLTGTMTDDLLDTTLTIPGGTVRLPKKTPRTLQTLERRPDIVVGRPKARRRAVLVPGAPGTPERPFAAKLHLVVPGRLFVRSDVPKVNVELKTDTTWRYEAGEVLAEGPLEVVRGTVEPISGRVFVVERGKVQFNGAGYREGVLDGLARWESPAATVTVVVDGPISDPGIKLTSVPPLDETAIAVLIATGRTELKVGTSDIGSMNAKEAGYAAGGAALSYLFQQRVKDILPFDQVSLDAGAIRAGKYLTDRIFVGYTRRFEANPEKGENFDEVRVEYQITPRWTLESRYGNAQSGGASLIWQRDY
jgi:translocation and assembly module TamB